LFQPKKSLGTNGTNRDYPWNIDAPAEVTGVIRTGLCRTGIAQRTGLCRTGFARTGFGTGVQKILGAKKPPL